MPIKGRPMFESKSAEAERFRNECAAALAANHGLAIITRRLEGALKDIADNGADIGGAMCAAIAGKALRRGQ